ncbi:peptidoglycan DD-metalloendopeptidase family protein [bacterium]|nr:peptidoglycan DD-metalloendopeptidase family protein [bacterium]
MKKLRGKKHLFIFILSGVLITLLPPHSFLQQDASDYEKRLKRISQQIEQVKAKIKKQEEKKSSVLSRLATVSFQKKLIQNQISLQQVKLKKANEELQTVQQRIDHLNSQMEKEKNSIKKILVCLYKFGKPSFFDYMLRAEEVESLFAESKYLSLLAQYQENIISDYIEILENLKETKEKQKTLKKEIHQLLSQAEQKRKALRAQERKHRALVRKIEQDKRVHQKTLQELKRRAEQLQILIEKLINENVSLPFNIIPLYEKKGKLLWPLEGQVVSKFGLHRHPRFSTITRNKGIEISPSQDKPIIKAVHPGMVVYEDYFHGYGNLIIVDHGLSYYSLYGHCSDFLVNKGDVVNKGEPIAVVGELSSLKGTTLYFELRFKSKPMDPLKWLKKR